MQRQADSVEDYVSAPAGAFASGESFLCGCPRPDVYVAFLWGRPSGAAMRRAVQALAAETGPGVARHVSYFDCSALTGVDSEAFGVMVDFWRQIAPRQKELVTRQALVRPGGLTGAVVAGFFHVFRPAYPARVFAAPGEACAWLGLDSAAAEPWTRQRDLARRLPRELFALRELLAGGRCHTVDDAARALGLSRRTLQRRLEESVTSFGAEWDRARLELARRRLTESDEKLATIAAELGFSAPQHFSEWFARRLRMTPSAFRRAHRLL